MVPGLSEADIDKKLANLKDELMLLIRNMKQDMDKKPSFEDL